MKKETEATRRVDQVIRLLLGDCIERMKTLDAASIEAVICDPPYG